MIRYMLKFPVEANVTQERVSDFMAMLKAAADNRAYRDICTSHGVTIVDMRRKGDVNAAFLAKARSRVR